MTKEEVSRRYNIPVSILDEYQSWGLCGVVQMAMDTQKAQRMQRYLALWPRR